MIVLTRLDRTPIAVNVDHLRWVEKTPDTVLSLVGGEHLRVLESLDEVVDAVRTERRRRLEAREPVDGAAVVPVEETT